MKKQNTTQSYASPIYQFCLALTALVLVAGCTSTPSEPDREPTRPSVVVKEKITLEDLSRRLMMDRSPRDLGFEEKVFDTCAVGLADSKTEACPMRYLVIVRFKLECRDSEGTVSDVDLMDIQPISRSEFKWKLGAIEGVSSTDNDGYGQIYAVAPLSQKTERLKLTVKNQFLVQRTEFVSRVVTPKTWCR